jgi:hypothetical protein
MKSKHKKVLSWVVAIVCTIALVVTGTYAWNGISKALDPSRARMGTNVPGANLHDDFLAETGEKEVYIENTGNADVYVRVQLSDLLARNTVVEPDFPVYDLYIPGDLSQAGNQFGEGFIWNFGNSVPYNYASLTTSADWAAASNRSTADDLVGDQRGDAISESTIVDLTVLPKDKTTPVGSVISMITYWDTSFDAQRDNFAGWVYDADGYVYWSQALPAGEATSLLINGITLPPKGKSTYYYGIKVNMEYVDPTDLEAWTDDANVQTGEGAGEKATTPTDEAVEMLKAIKEKRDETEFVRDPQVGDEFTASGWDWVIVAIDDQGNAMVMTKNVIGTSLFGESISTAPYVGAYNGSTIDNIMGDFYESLKTTDENPSINKITKIALPSDYATKITSYVDRENRNPGLSAVTTTGTPKCFAVSFQEIETHLAGRPNLYLATKPNAEFGSLGNNYWLSGDEQCYWTRTPGFTYGKAPTWPDGTFGYSMAVTESGISVRPALWIRTK